MRLHLKLFLVVLVVAVACFAGGCENRRSVKKSASVGKDIHLAERLVAESEFQLSDDDTRECLHTVRRVYAMTGSDMVFQPPTFKYVTAVRFLSADFQRYILALSSEKPKVSFRGSGLGRRKDFSVRQGKIFQFTEDSIVFGVTFFNTGRDFSDMHAGLLGNIVSFPGSGLVAFRNIEMDKARLIIFEKPQTNVPVKSPAH